MRSGAVRSADPPVPAVLLGSDVWPANRARSPRSWLLLVELRAEVLGQPKTSCRRASTSSEISGSDVVLILEGRRRAAGARLCSCT